MIEAPRITLSIVSHGQGGLIGNLLGDLRRLAVSGLEIIVTLNVPENEGFLQAIGNDHLRVIRNPAPLGFGANHNQAFAQARGDVFCVVNPDIRLDDAGFISLLLAFDDPRVGCVAPLVIGSDGKVQDSARRFPSIARILRRVVLRQRTADYAPDVTAEVDWTAGMFILYRRAAFAQLGGFDERYFMYLEDADIGRRLRHAGWKVLYNPSISVIHDARRDSHRSLRHLRWHTRGIIRFLTGF